MTDVNICCICTNYNENFEVTKQRCNHVICWKCLKDHVTRHLAAKIRCPGLNCAGFLSDGAIRKVLSDEEIAKYEQIMMNKITLKLKCLLSECPHVYICEDRNVQFDCPECSLFNCLLCNAPHKFLSCAQYQISGQAKQYCQTELNRAIKVVKKRKRDHNREMFIKMDDEDLLLYDNMLECPVCCRTLGRGDAIILRCSHIHCRYCLHDHIMNTTNIPITCQSDKCNQPLLEREIFMLISKEELRIYVDRCNACIKGKLEFTFQCQSPDCVYFVEFTVKPDSVYCPLCRVTNCTSCFAIHVKETCAQFKYRIKDTPYGKNLLRIEERIRNKEIMKCLKCHQILEKVGGCNWIQCTNCQFEMCWILQMRRWGPKGRGDISDGCKCGVGGKRCHPDCSSCIPHIEPRQRNGPPPGRPCRVQ